MQSAKEHAAGGFIDNPLTQATPRAKVAARGTLRTQMFNMDAKEI